MKEESNKRDQTATEIDLLQLFASVGRGIRRFFTAIIKVILYLFLFGIRRFVWLLLAVLIGAGLGFFLSYSLTDRFYSSEMVAQPNGFTCIDMARYINDIHDLCLDRNYSGIQSAFNVSEEHAMNIKDIEVFYLIDVNGDNIGDYVDYAKKYDPADTLKTIILNRIIIQAKVLNNTSFQERKNGLQYYINKNPYLDTVNAIKKQELRELIDQADNEIMKLDTLQNYEYYKSLKDEMNNYKESQMIFLNEKQTQLYYQDKVSLLSRKLQYTKDLKLATEPITIIKDFSELVLEENTLIEYIFYSILFTLIFAYILILIIFNFKRIDRYLSSMTEL